LMTSITLGLSLAARWAYKVASRLPANRIATSVTLGISRNLIPYMALEY
jgi:hypothetical protein